MTARKLRLTKRAVEALKTAKREEIVWDTDLAGFGVRVFPSGTKTYLVQYRSPRTRTTKKVKLGRHGVVTVEDARREAQRLLGRIAAREDPAGALAEDRVAPTVDAVWRRWFAEHVEVKLKPRTREEYARTYRLHVRPVIGALKVKDVALDDINMVIQHHGASRHQANRTRAQLHTLFEYADRLGLRPDGKNPV